MQPNLLDYKQKNPNSQLKCNANSEDYTQQHHDQAAWGNYQIDTLDCTSRNNQGPFATGKIRGNIEFAAFRCVFFWQK